MQAASDDVEVPEQDRQEPKPAVLDPSQAATDELDITAKERTTEQPHLAEAQDLDDMLEEEDVERVREEVERELTELHVHAPDQGVLLHEAIATWHRLEALTSSVGERLTEQLRLVLEASVASRMSGDYRTGKRLNMRKIIPYIASQFRKDKIWLRRSKPSKREYQVAWCVPVCPHEKLMACST